VLASWTEFELDVFCLNLAHQRRTVPNNDNVHFLLDQHSISNANTTRRLERSASVLWSPASLRRARRRLWSFFVFWPGGVAPRTLTCWPVRTAAEWTKSSRVLASPRAGWPVVAVALRSEFCVYKATRELIKTAQLERMADVSCVASLYGDADDPFTEVLSLSVSSITDKPFFSPLLVSGCAPRARAPTPSLPEKSRSSLGP